MSKTLVIIMLDFFMMISIVFFVLQYIQPDSAIAGAGDSAAKLVMVKLDRTAFYATRSDPGPADLNRLVDVSVAAFRGSAEVPQAQVFVAKTYEGLVLMVLGGEGPITRLVLYAKKLHSVRFGQVPVQVSAGNGEGGNVNDVTWIILSNPSLDLPLSLP